MPLAFVFPGQGSQSVGMLKDMAEAFPQVQEAFSEASDVLGFDLWQLVQQGPEEKLNKTQITQPAMLAAGVSVWRVWQSEGGGIPALMAGHSLGEYSAFVCAGSLDFIDAVQLVADRGRYMQEAVPVGEGGMAAILGLDDDAVSRLCHASAEDDVLAPVNFNSPGQVVIAGTASAVARAVSRAKEDGAKRALILPVSVPSHCDLMQVAAQRLAQRLQAVEIQPPTIPVLHNLHARPETSAKAIRETLVRQIESPVQWVKTIQAMASQGINKWVECGPGKVLTGLNKRIIKSAETHCLTDPDSIYAALSAVADSEPLTQR